MRRQNAWRGMEMLLVVMEVLLAVMVIAVQLAVVVVIVQLAVMVVEMMLALARIVRAMQLAVIVMAVQMAVQRRDSGKAQGQLQLAICTSTLLRIFWPTRARDNCYINRAEEATRLTCGQRASRPTRL